MNLWHIFLGVSAGALGVLTAKLLAKRQATEQKKVAEKYAPLYEQFLIDLEKGKAKNAQIFEDMEMNRKIHDEAFRLYENWQDAPQIDINGKEEKLHLMLINPGKLGYIIYDEETAKYAKVDRVKLVVDQFEKLKTELV